MGPHPQSSNFKVNLGVDCEFLGRVPVEQFDTDASLRNQARVYTQLDEAQVELYAEAVKRGDDFPAVIASKAGRTSRLILADGNQDAILLGVRQNTSCAAPPSPCREPLDPARQQEADTHPPGPVSTDPWQASAALRAAFLGSLAPSTRVGYGYDLDDLQAFCERLGGPPLLLTRVDLELYLRELREDRGLAAATIRRRVAAIRGLFLRAVEDGLLQNSPADRLRLPRPDPAPPRLRLTPADLLALTDAAEGHSDRAGLLLHLLCWSGLRVSEAVSVDVDDLRPDGLLTVRGKGGRRRLVPITPTATALAGRLSRCQPSGALLRSRTGRRLHRSDAARLFTTIARVALPAQVADRGHPHAARRGLASGCLDAGASLLEVQLLLGHADAATTTVYWEPPDGGHRASIFLFEHANRRA